MDETRKRLIAWTLGDLSPEEFRALVPTLAADEDLDRQRGQIERTVNILRAMPADDAADSLVQRLMAAAEEAQHQVIEIAWYRRALPRVAAAAAIVFVLGAGVWLTPTGMLVRDLGVVTDDGTMSRLLPNQPVESRVGETRRISFPTGEVLLDGASTVTLQRTGEYTPPVVNVERGRVVITAATAPLTVNVADRSVRLEKGALLAVNYDRAYANIAADGSSVEIQRVQISYVAELAERVYGIKLNTAGLPQSVRDTRVTFYGRDLNSHKFVDSFIEATAEYGVRIDATRQNLSYVPSPGRIHDNDEWQLEIALLDGRAALEQAGGSVALDDSTNLVTLSATGSGRAEYNAPEELNKQVVWAAGTSGPWAERLRNVRQSEQPLPGGTVVYADKMVLYGDMGKRIYKLGASEYDYILPGGRKGRVVQLTSSGAVFEVQNELVREFVPFGQ